MGIAFDPAEVRGPDGHVLTGASHGAARAFGVALAALDRDDPSVAVEAELALRLAPQFGLALILWAHSLVSDDDLAPFASGLLFMAGRMAGTARERSHLKIATLRASRDGPALKLALAAHARSWPGDDMLTVILTKTGSVGPDAQVR
jgi:hypothetical protein